MDGRTRARSLLGIAAPIFLLALAALADLIFHHGYAPAPVRSPPRQVAAIVDRAPPTVEDVREKIGLSCAGPEGVDDCALPALAAAFASDAPVLRANRDQLERLWTADLAAGDPVGAYGLALLGSRRSLSLLRERLLAERYFYGWETSSPDDPKILFANDQFPHHIAIVRAIEWIDGRPLRSAVRLSRHERRRLVRDAAGCDGWVTATWLLHELDGAPLPGAAANRARRLGCDGP